MLQGKSPDCLSRAPDGGPTPRKYANILTTTYSRKVREQEVTRPNLLGWKRKNVGMLPAEDVEKQLREVRVGEGVGGERRRVGPGHDASGGWG